MKLAHFPLEHVKNIVILVRRMVAIWDEAVVHSFRYFGVIVIEIAIYCNIFDIVEKGINFRYHAHTVDLAVWLEEVHVAPEASKSIM